LLSSPARLAIDVNRWRAITIYAFLVALVSFWVTGAPWVTSPVVLALSGWALLAHLWDRLIKQQLTPVQLDRLMVLVSIVDLTMVDVCMTAASGAWWLGPSMHLVVIAAGALSLRKLPMLAVTAYGAFAYAMLIFGETMGWWLSSNADGASVLTGEWAKSIQIVLLGLLAILPTGLLLWSFQARVHRVHRRFRQVFEASPYIIFTARPDGRITSGNPVARQYGVAESVAQPIDGLIERIDVEGRESFVRALEQAFLGVGGQVEAAVLRDDGALRWLRMTFSPTGTVEERRVLIMAADITEERNTAQARDRLEREVESAGRMRLVGQLVSGVAHELNNPLAAILNFGELLQAEPRSAEDSAALEVIHAQAMRARTIVRDLLHVARASGGRVREDARIDEIVRRALPPLVGRAAEAGSLLQLSVVGEVPCQRVDVPGIEQVVTNLVSNAIDAAPGGSVWVIVRGEADGTHVEVRDSGSGIPADVRAHIFEPFYTTKAPGSGTGLGLAVSRGIVEQHGGSIEVENGAAGSGVGARFLIWLPLLSSRSSQVVEPDAVVSVDPVAPEPAPRIRQALLLDDEDVVRAPMARALRNKGWVVTECSDGEAALALLCSQAGQAIEVIVSDIKMPRVDGPTFYRRLAAERPDMAARVLFATGDTASDEVAHFLAASRCPVIEKPFTLKALVEQVTRIADGLAPTVGAP
jgi:PAS domain S-box-containing protein